MELDQLTDDYLKKPSSKINNKIDKDAKYKLIDATQALNGIQIIFYWKQQFSLFRCFFYFSA